jgi:hypothetical protein
MKSLRLCSLDVAVSEGRQGMGEGLIGWTELKK